METRSDARVAPARLRSAATLLVALAVILLHWPPAGAEFAYDDRDLVVTNQAVLSLGTAAHGFARPFPPEQPERALYRPLTQLSYALDHALFGMNARAFHATNVLLYAATCAGVAGLATVLLGSGGPALAVAWLWAFHPVHTEAVDGVAGRSELLALGFGLAALLTLLRRHRSGPAWVSAACYALACLSKETGVVTLGVLAVAAWARSPAPRLRTGLRALRPLAPHLAVGIGYLALRTAVLGRFSPEAAILAGHGAEARVLTAGAVFAENLRLLVAPVTLQPDFYYQALIGIVERPGPRAVTGLAAAAALLALAARLAWRHATAPAPLEGAAERERATALVGFACFFGFLLPTSHLLDIGALLAERFLFAPSLGFVLLAVVGGERLRRRLSVPPTVAALLVALVVGLGAVRSHARAADWRDPARLWQSVGRRVSGDVRIHANLAAVYLERGRLDAAAAEIDRALALDPKHVPSLGNRGVLELQRGQLDRAEATYREILALEPRDFLARYNLGLIALRRDRPEEAAEWFRQALAINPNHAWSVRGLAQARAAAAHAAPGTAQGASRAEDRDARLPARDQSQSLR